MTTSERQWPEELANDELRLQLDFLRFLRHTAVSKVAGLGLGLAAAAPIATSPRMTALGVLKHLTAAERHWFSITAAASGLPSLWAGSPDPSWDLSDADTPDTVIAGYRAEWARSADALAERGAGDRAAGGPYTIRWIVAHMNQETARHVGHLDLVRELADGEVGE